MLLDAIEAAYQGKRVIVVSTSYKHSDQLITHAVDLLKTHITGWSFNRAHMKISFDSGSIQFKPQGGYPGHYGFDWDRLKFQGEGGEVLIDHHTIETAFASVLYMLHRWDSPRTSMRVAYSGQL